MSACPACGGFPSCRCSFIRPDRPAPQLYHIRIQRRCEYNGRFSRNDWRAYREYLVWPKTFASSVAAEKFMEECFTFAGITGRKLSATVARCGALLVIPLMLILGGWASNEKHIDWADPDYAERHRLERQIDETLLMQERLEELWLEQQRQARELRCQKHSIRYRCQELME